MPSRGALILLFLAACAVFGLTARGQLPSTDSLVTLHAAQAWWERGKPALLPADKLTDGRQSLGAAEPYIVSVIAPPRGPDGEPTAKPRFGMQAADGSCYVWFPIGHQALLVPMVALDGVLQARWPEPAQRHLESQGPAYGALFWGKFLASFLSPLSAAVSFVLLLWISARLGAAPRQSLLAALLGTFCTQFFATGNENLSNMPGTALFLAGLTGVIGYVRGAPARRSLLTGGLLAGLAVLVRYPLLLTFLPFWLWAAWHALRQRSVKDLGWLVLGGLPGAILLAAANHWRFGSITETGYSASAGFGEFPVWQGLISILFAFGKGVVWFSPLLVWALLRLRRRAAWHPAVVCALAVLLTNFVLFGGVVYWAAGQCWGIRYLSLPVALLVALVASRDLPPAGRARRPLLILAVLGLLLSLGGILTSYSSQQKAATPAAQTLYGDQQNLDNNVNWDWRLSPLHSHWTWAWHSANGHLDDMSVRTASQRVFGIDPTFPAVNGVEQGTRLGGADVRFRHLWWRWLPLWMPGFPGSLVAMALAGIALLCGVLGGRWWLRGARSAAPEPVATS